MNEQRLRDVFAKLYEESSAGLVHVDELDDLLMEDELIELERRGMITFTGDATYMVPRSLQVEFSERVVKMAHELIAMGKVSHVQDDVWKVKDYTIISNGEWYGRCSCPHGVHGTPVGISTCKHVYAVFMTTRDKKGA